ncbi:MAG: hypothetical protein ACTHMM_08480 [Agriterribacter sp.]
MNDLKDFCVDAMTDNNRHYYEMGYQAALQEQEAAQLAAAAREIRNVVIGLCCTIPLLLAFAGDIITGGAFSEILFALMFHAD